MPTSFPTGRAIRPTTDCWSAKTFRRAGTCPTGSRASAPTTPVPRSTSCSATTTPSSPTRSSRLSSTSPQNEAVDGRWRYIEHSATSTRVLIRLQRQTYAVPEEIRITGVIYLPWRPGDPITSQLLRELPTARIEAAINQPLFAMRRASTITGAKIELPQRPQGLRAPTCSSPSATPNALPTSTSLVALQHGRLTTRGDRNPSATMAELSGVALSATKAGVAKGTRPGTAAAGAQGGAPADESPQPAWADPGSCCVAESAVDAQSRADSPPGEGSGGYRRAMVAVVVAGRSGRRARTGRRGTVGAESGSQGFYGRLV